MRAADCSTDLQPPIDLEIAIDGPLNPAEAMARDAAALEAQRSAAARPSLRLYRWAEPALTIGRLQDESAALALARTLGVGSVVRRPTGGGAVHHTDDVSFSLAWRRDHPAFPRCVAHVYRALHQRLAGALRAAGVADATLYAGGGDPRGGFCYASPVRDDVMSGGRKIVGGALRVTSYGRLYQGNLKIGPDVLSKEAVEVVRAAWTEA